MMRMLTLSGPGDVLEGIDDTIRSTCVQVTVLKLKSSSDEFLVNQSSARKKLRLIYSPEMFAV